MTGTTHRFVRAVSTVLAALLLGAPFASVASAAFDPGGMRLTPPMLHRQFHWYHWHPSARVLQARAGEFADLRTFGSTAVIGLESNRTCTLLATTTASTGSRRSRSSTRRR